jgi:hypothetical protein
MDKEPDFDEGRFLFHVAAGFALTCVIVPLDIQRMTPQHLNNPLVYVIEGGITWMSMVVCTVTCDVLLTLMLQFLARLARRLWIVVRAFFSRLSCDRA